MNNRDLKSVSTTYGVITPAQIRTMHHMTRNTKDREHQFGIEMVRELYLDGTEETLIVMKGSEIEFHIRSDGTVRTS